jgi:hypothetical protein
MSFCREDVDTAPTADDISSICGRIDDPLDLKDAGNIKQIALVNERFERQ